MVSVIQGTTITASFDRTTMSGNAGCNSYSGPYQTDATKIRIGPIAAICCDDDRRFGKRRKAFVHVGH